MVEEKILNLIIKCFYEDKQKLDIYKKSTEKYNSEIKELMSKLDKDVFETDDGLLAKMSIQQRESFDEDKLIEKLKALNGHTAIKTKEYVDMDELENLIYNGHLDASQLSNCKIVKKVITLKVNKRKGKLSNE